MNHLDISGDSFSAPTISSGYNLPLNQRWPHLVATELGIGTVDNRATNGDQAADQSYKAQGVVRVADDLVAILVGTNDVRIYKDSVTKRGYYERFLRRLIADAVLPKRVKARDAAMVKTGAWANTQVNPTGMYSTAMGASAKATVSGDVVYIGHIIQNHSAAQSSADVYIDGVKAGTISCDGTGGMNTANGLSYAPALARFPTTPGQHAVEVRVTSSGKNFYLDDIRGSDQPDTPLVLVSNLTKWGSAGYSNWGTTLAMVNSFNAVIGAVVASYEADGFAVDLVDSYSVLDPTTDLMADGLHPNAAGQRKIADKFKEVLQNYPRVESYQTAWGTTLRLTLVENTVTEMVEV
ncbi:MAG: hypothetical protein KK482_10060 [Sinorhizobium meliloti]|nr:hypothetical protein [Sinorhizobium meliloti]